MTDFVPGGIANEHGDLFGSTPLRIIPHGRVVIDSVRAGAALMCGWRVVEKVNPNMAAPSDPAFAWLDRTAHERMAYDACHNGIIS